MLRTEVPPPLSSPDVALINGRVFTPDGWVQSVAMVRNAIVALGSDRDVRALCDSATRVVDLGGKTVLPGLCDMHVHPTGAGLAEMQCRLPHGSAPEQIFAITEAYARRRQAGDWISGRAFETASFGDTPPHKAMLDRVAPENPVYFSDISGHSGWANSRALQLAGISRERPIHRTASSSATSRASRPASCANKQPGSSCGGYRLRVGRRSPGRSSGRWTRWWPRASPRSTMPP